MKDVTELMSFFFRSVLCISRSDILNIFNKIQKIPRELYK